MPSAQQLDQSKLQGGSGEDRARQGAQLRLCTFLVQCLLYPWVSRVFPQVKLCVVGQSFQHSEPQ